VHVRTWELTVCKLEDWFPLLIIGVKINLFKNMSKKVKVLLDPVIST